MTSSDQVPASGPGDPAEPLDPVVGAVLDAVVDGLVVTDEVGVIRAVNRAVEGIFGYAAAELLGEPVETLMPPHEAAAHGGYMERYVATNEPHVLGVGREVVGRRRDGSLVPLHLSLGETHVGGRRLFAGVLRDLSADKHAVNQRRLAEFTVDHAGDAIYWIDANANFLYANDAACRDTGYSREELLSMRVFDLDMTMNRDMWSGHWATLIDKEMLTLESTHRHRSGRRFPVEVVVNHVRVDGTDLNCAFARDVSSRRQATRELRESEARKAAILEAALDCVVTIDHEGRIVEFNPAAERTFGHARERVLGRLIAEVIIPERFREAHAQGMAHYLATGEGPVLRQHIELPALHADGREFPVEISITPIDLGDKPLFTAYLRDITLRKEAEDALRSGKEEAESASAFKSQFLANMSHEIRTPMMAVLGYADLLARSGRTPAQNRDWTSALRRNADYLHSLVGGVLDLSKIEAGELEIQQSPCNLVALLNDVVALFRARASEKMVAFDLEYETAIPDEITIDPTRLQQILVNLVGNAVKFTHEGHVRIIARADEQDDGARLEIKVEDSGPGIPRERLPSLFLPFSQVHESREARLGGTGLGLTISRHLARLLGGDIEVESELGKGTTFTLELGVALPATGDWIQPATASMASPEGGLDSIPSLAGRRVLVADDNEDNRRILRYLLEDTGAEIHTVAQGQEAVDAIREAAHAECPYDALLLDMSMPVMDGYEAARCLREGGETLPIIALTAYTLSGDREKTLQAGCDDYLPKPISPPDLYAVLARRVPTGAPAEPPSRAEARLVSDRAGDERFRPLLQDYVEGLMETEQAFLTAQRAADRIELQRLAHQLKGTGSSYGFPALTEEAGACEAAIRDDASEESVLALGRRVLAVLAAIRRGASAG